MRRRSRSLIPPQMPNFSPFARAYSRQSSRTTHPRQTSLASLVDAPRSGKNRSGSTPMQFALRCQVRCFARIRQLSIIEVQKFIGPASLVVGSDIRTIPPYHRCSYSGVILTPLWRECKKNSDFAAVRAAVRIGKTPGQHVTAAETIVCSTLARFVTASGAR